jgi:hypothetical protein
MRTHRKNVFGGMAISATILIVACGSDSGSSGVQSGVDPAKPADMASAADAQKVCSAIASYAAMQLNGDLARRTLCLELTAVPASTGKAPTVAECNDSVQRCLGMTQGSSAQPRNTNTVGCVGGTTVPPNCTATVGEIQACATAAIDATSNYFNGLTCDLWGLPPAEAQARIQATPPTPASCTAIQQKCPGLISTQTN